MVRATMGIALLLGACASGQCDPSQAGFLSGIGCEAGGNYRVRNQVQQSALAQQNDSALQARASAQSEQSRATEAVLTRDQARRRLNTVDQQTRQLRARLNTARRQGTVDQVRLDQAQQELDGLQRQRTQMPAQSTDEQVRALEARQRRAAELMGGI